MVEVTSSDMSLLFETPGTVFDEASMTNEFGSDGPSVPGRRERISGTTEVGVVKSVSEGAGKSRRKQVLLKARVVLRKDVAEVLQSHDSAQDSDSPPVPSPRNPSL